MIKNFAWLGLLIMAASCAGGDISAARDAVIMTPTIQPSNTAQPVENTLTPSPTFTIIPSLTTTPLPADAITQPLPDSVPFEQVQPLPEDSNMPRGKVFIDRIELRDGKLHITGSLPTPCHKLRVVINDPAFVNKVIRLSVYSLRDDSLICIQSLAPFQLDVPLKDLQDGSYTVMVNEVSQLKFNWPEN